MFNTYFSLLPCCLVPVLPGPPCCLASVLPGPILPGSCAALPRTYLVSLISSHCRLRKGHHKNKPFNVNLGRGSKPIALALTVLMGIDVPSSIFNICFSLPLCCLAPCCLASPLPAPKNSCACSVGNQSRAMLAL